jgi:hypothetical protein
VVPAGAPKVGALKLGAPKMLVDVGPSGAVFAGKPFVPSVPVIVEEPVVVEMPV